MRHVPTRAEKIEKMPREQMGGKSSAISTLAPLKASKKKNVVVKMMLPAMAVSFRVLACVRRHVCVRV